MFMLLTRARYLAVLTFGMLLAVSLAVGPAHAGAVASNAQVPAGPAASGMAVAGGTVTSATGTAMPGVAVDLYAWPSDAVQKALKPGALVPTTLLATATTNNAGKYMLRVPAAKLKAAAVESGYANLEVFSAVGGFWFFSYQAGSLPAQPSAPVTVNLGGKKKPPSCGLDPRHRPYVFTGFKLERQRPKAWAVVGQGYIIRQKNHLKRTAGDFVAFNYNQGASHTQASHLGVGISGYGFEAGYQTDGSHTSTASRTEFFPKGHANTWFRTQFTTAQFRGACYEPSANDHVPYQHQHGQCPRSIPGPFGEVLYVHKCFWVIKSTGWAGGANLKSPTSPTPRTPANNCSPQPATSHFAGDFGAAVQWSSGFDLGAALGVKGTNLKASFNGSAQTGYDVNAVMDFRFPNHAGWLCGTNGQIATASILVARGNLPAH